MKAILFTAKARKQFTKLPADVREAVQSKLARYAETGVGPVIKMVGEDAARLRSGDYRVIFVETESALDIRAVGHRRDVYR